MKKYFVSYYWASKTQEGRGWIEMGLKKRITSYDSIKTMVAILNKDVTDEDGNECKCVVTNYKRLAWWSR